MTSNMSLDMCDRTVLDLLTRRVRLAAQDQICCYSETQQRSSSSMGRRLHRLAKLGLLFREQAVIGYIPFVKPLFVSRPNQNEPDYDALAWQLEWRWTHADSEPHALFWASPRAVQLFGGSSGWLRQPLQIQHDLAVTAVFLRRMQTCRPQMAGWVSEDSLRRRSTELRLHAIPDAAVVGENGAIQTIIELGGVYSAEKLRRFHRHFRAFHYELW